MSADRTVRIGGAAGFWGDSLDGARQLVARGGIDYLVFDYLAEITLALLARIRARKPDLGYVPDFVEVTAAVLPEVMARGIRVVSNGGGMNPRAAAAELARRAAALGLSPKIAVITGDDLLRIEEFRAAGTTEMFTGAAMPERVASANAYLGAGPIAAALAAGADIVITGRCVNSAVTLGALMHAFGWSPDDHDRLAAGSLAGHLIECGAQVTGGIATDWNEVPGWEDMGFPVVECREDGSFVVTKPAGTGGLITPLTVAEQMLYEIGDPAAYLLPDVACDFRFVTMTPDGPDRVRVSGARGRPPTGSLKVSATWQDGFRTIGTVTIGGRDAAAKAKRAGEAMLARRAPCRRGRSWSLRGDLHRGARQRGHLWRQGPRRGCDQPRGGAQDRRPPFVRGAAGASRARDRPGGNRHGPGPDGFLRGTAGRAARLSRLFLPRPCGQGRGDTRDRRCHP